MNILYMYFKRFVISNKPNNTPFEFLSSQVIQPKPTLKDPTEKGTQKPNGDTVKLKLVSMMIFLSKYLRIPIYSRDYNCKFTFYYHVNE